MSEVTRILNAIERGDPRAAEQLLPLVYEELRQLAAQKLENVAWPRDSFPRLVQASRGQSLGVGGIDRQEWQPENLSK